MKQLNYKTIFVDRMPPDDNLQNGVVYVAPHFEVAVHKCMCGCGEKVVTPITEGQWSWNYDGANISLSPSIGNYQYNCKAHYFLKNGNVMWI